MSRVGLNPTPKTDEHGDDGDQIPTKLNIKIQKIRRNPNEIESQKNLKKSRPNPLDLDPMNLGGSIDLGNSASL